MGRKFHFTRQPGANLAVARIEQLPLLHCAVALIDENKGLFRLGTAVHTQAVRIGETRRLDAVGDRFQQPRGRIDGVNRDAVIGPVARGDERDRLARKHKSFAQVDVVHLAIGQILELFARQVIDIKPRLFLRGDDDAARRVCRIDPHCRIVGCIAAGFDR